MASSQIHEVTSSQMQYEAGPCQRGYKESHATSEADLLSCVWDEVLPLIEEI